ncbi:outer membrane lipid asymmetry maintenance protein MlaD [Acidocella sp.]|uniref:outer membrane lipid asymmetry maintenance protein MlaD n=1 Tax=Acidocella sp. TaxID=50710 RepID=UPI002603BF59|nr:outer membrane lipid asymmetry maintenance protein MlaD [Acidocella sp.]
MTRRLPELLTGLGVILVAVLFLLYALRGAGELNTGGYRLTARFGSVGALAIGADVKIGGVVVGHVASEVLDPVTYAAVVGLDINNAVQIPSDSAASVTSDSLLGNDYVNVSPGGSNDMLKPGSAFATTQSAVNIGDLLGKFIFSLGGASSAKGNGAGAATTPANPASLAN